VFIYRDKKKKKKSNKYKSYIIQIEGGGEKKAMINPVAI